MLFWPPWLCLHVVHRHVSSPNTDTHKIKINRWRWHLPCLSIRSIKKVMIIKMERLDLLYSHINRIYGLGGGGSCSFKEMVLGVLFLS